MKHVCFGRNLSRVTRIRAASTKNEIAIYGEIGWSYFGGHITAADVRAQLRALEDDDEVVVRVNSPGGDAVEGAAIYTLLRDAKQRVVVKIDGAAFSAASVIAMAGDEVQVSSVAMLMVHNAWTIAAGDSEEMRTTADRLDRVNRTLAAAYAEKTGKTVEEALALMAAETWMTPNEAKELGFADSIMGAEGDPEPVVEAHHLERFRNAPKNLERFLKSTRSASRVAATARRPAIVTAPALPELNPELVAFSGDLSRATHAHRRSGR